MSKRLSWSVVFAFFFVGTGWLTVGAEEGVMRNRLLPPGPGNGRNSEEDFVELKDGRPMMWCRTDAGSQYVCFSTDGGETWSAFGPSKIISPYCSPASIERIPKTGDLLLVWNNHQNVDNDTVAQSSRSGLALTKRESGRDYRDCQGKP